MADYRLGVDLGTTFTAAAVLRPGGAPEVVPLGMRSATVPSVLFLSADGGDVLVGEAAERRAVTDPDRVVRQFKRRVGDPTPLLIGPAGDQEGCAAHELAAAMIAWVVARVAEREGCPPAAIAVTHPATWGPHKKDLLRAALADCDLPEITLVTEPEAAARTYAYSGRIAPGATLAVYDLGGGTFDAALLQATPDGQFTPLGRPNGLPDLGGIDFDDAILAHVLAALGPAAAELDTTDPDVRTALTRLRRECVDAKEALSVDTTTTIPVLLADLCTNVRLTRAELDAMITPALQTTLDALDATLDSAGITGADLTHVVLTGGSSRVPAVAQLLSRHFGESVSLERDIDPKTAVAVGSVLAIAGAAQVATVAIGAPAVVTDATPAPVAAEVPAEPTTVGTAARAAAPAPALGARPARPTSSSAPLTDLDAERIPAPRSRMRPRRALALLTLTTALMLGTGVALSAMVAPQDGPGSSTSGVPSGGLDMATPKKQDGADQKAAETKSDAAATTSAPQAKVASSADPAAVVPATGTSSDSRVERASVTRKTATAKPTGSGDAAKSTSDSRRAGKLGAPVDARTVAEPSEFAVPPEAPAEPAGQAEPTGTDSASTTDVGSAPADSPAGSDPAANPPAAPEQPADASEPTSGFGETAPPEAP